MRDNIQYNATSGSFNASGMLAEIVNIAQSLGEWKPLSIVALGFCALSAAVAWRFYNRSVQSADGNTIKKDGIISQTGSAAFKYFTGQYANNNTLEAGSKLEQTFK